MKERPILFSGPMVRALLDGSKTQTRRAMKPQPTEFVGGPGVTLQDGSPAPLIPLDDSVEPYGREIACPYGKLGDRLWVRETWHDASSSLHSCALYRADGIDLHWDKWAPSIHMPRWASRITLEITSVRVERLQDISEADALAEGIVECPIPADDEGPRRIGYMVGPDDGKSGLSVTPIQAYRDLWESINGPESWAANPWVWAIEFRRLP